MTKPKYTKKGLNGRQIDQAEIFFGNNSFSGTDMVATMTITGTEKANGSHVLGSIQTLSYSIHQEKQPIRSIGNINAKDYVMGPRTIAGSLVFAVFDRHFAYAAMSDIERTHKNYHFLADEMPPFDITITYANEYGANSKLALYGVRLVNEGQVMSINDIYTENTYQFVATDIDYLESQNISNSILDKNMFNKYDPDSIGIPPNTAPYINQVIPNQEIANQEVIQSKSYELTLDNKMPYVYETKEPGSIEVTLTPQPEKPSKLIVKAYYGNEMPDIYIDIKPDSVFPVKINNLAPGAHQVFFEQDDTTVIYKDFVIDVIKQSETTEQPSQLVVYRRGEDEDGCYFLCQSIGLLDKVEYRESKKHNAPWMSEFGPDARRDFKIARLKPNTEYLLRGVRLNNTSDTITATTTEKGESLDKYDYLGNLIDTNKDDTSQTKLSVYEIIIEAAKEYAKEHEGITMAEAISAIKNNENEFYIDFCIATAMAYENEILWATSETICPPLLHSASQSAIVLEKDTRWIEIEKIGYCPQKVTREHMIPYNGKYLYRIHDSEGLYKIKRFDSDNKVSIPMMIAIYNQKYREKLLNSEKLNALTKEQAINRVKAHIYEQLKELSDKDKELTLIEHAEESNHFKTFVMQPYLIDHTENEVGFIHQTGAYEQMYCCLQKTSDMLEGKLVHKKLVGQQTKYYANFTVVEQGLIKGERYSVWYETKEFQKISPIMSFEFGNYEEDVIITNKQNSLIKKLYNSFKTYFGNAMYTNLSNYICNKLLDLDASSYSHYGEIYDTLIEDMFLNKDLSRKDTYLLLYHTLHVFMAINHEMQVDWLAEIKHSAKDNALTIIPREDLLIHRVIISKEGTKKLYLLKAESTTTIDLSFIESYGNVGVVYLTSLDGKVVSKPIMIDYDNPVKIYGTLKENTR